MSALCHVTVRPVSGLPDASLGVAVSCTVPFTTMLADAGVTSTVLTGIFVMVTAAVPLFPSAVAVTVTGPPAAFPVTRPLASTVASVMSALCHVTVRPASGLPDASLGVAVSCTVPFTTMLAVAGVTSAVLTALVRSGQRDVGALPRDGAAGERIAGRVLGRGRELHRPVHQDARRRGRDVDRTDRDRRDGDGRRAALPFYSRRDRDRATRRLPGHQTVGVHRGQRDVGALPRDGAAGERIAGRVFGRGRELHRRAYLHAGRRRAHLHRSDGELRVAGGGASVSECLAGDGEELP